MLLFAEGEVTRLRREFKLVLHREVAAQLCARLSSALAGHLPPATHIVSVYFDKPGLPLAQRALTRPHDCIKVRTKEYAPDVGAGGVDRVVLEVKREHLGVTRKRRVWVARRRLAVVREGGVALLPLIAGGSLQPVLAVAYRRHVYQSSDAWRVTVDHDVSYHPVTAPLALGPERLSPERLPPPCHVDELVVVEVKHSGPVLPEWIASLQRLGGRSYSKFGEGMAVVHGAALAGMAELARVAGG